MRKWEKLLALLLMAVMLAALPDTVWAADADSGEFDVAVEDAEEGTYESSSGTPFYITNVYSEESGSYQSYRIDTDNDSYAEHYQTVFLLDYDSSSSMIPVAAKEIYPAFSIDSKARVIAVGADGRDLGPQVSRQSAVPFRSGGTIQYTVYAENEEASDNYFITFVTQQEGARLYVNAQDNIYDPDAADPEPYREIHLDDADAYHNILFANIGDEELTGLYVKLEGTDTLALDPYWTNEDSVGTLAAYDELPDLGKIRLIPKVDENGEAVIGPVDGYLVIASENGGEVRIKLTGTTGRLSITNTNLSDGVQYVPYSSGIWTNFSGDNLEYILLGGTLPSPITLNQNTGEIYGVPKVYGDFPIKVQVQYKDLSGRLSEESLERMTAEAEYTLTILENTDDNVWGATDEDYTVTKTIGVRTSGNHFVWSSGEDDIFISQGEFQRFVDLYLDGDKLTVDVDYDAASGSTVITVRAQTLNSTGSDTHTLAAEFRDANGDLRKAAQNYAVSITTLAPGVKYVPYSWKPQNPSGTYSVVSGTLPNGLSVDPQTGEISGVPMVSSTWNFTVSNQDAETAYSLTIEDNTNTAVQRPNDYDIITPIGDPSPTDPHQFILYKYTDKILLIDGPYFEFMRLLIDGRELTREVDYHAEEGSTSITIYGQTFEHAGDGTHTIAAEFRENGDPDGALKTVSQNYTVSITTPSSGNGNGSNSGKGRNPSATTPAATDSTEDTAPKVEPDTGNASDRTALPFGDVSPSSWFYEDVKWAYEEGIMTGVSETSFAPGQSISQATIVTVLARLGAIDLARFETAVDDSIESDKWYSAAALWAKQSGILPDYSVFTGEETISRDQMAIMLVKYLRSMGKDTTPPTQPTVFADADLMSQEGNNAFQTLYQYGIFRGVGDGKMDPADFTTRAQFAALVHRINGL